MAFPELLVKMISLFIMGSFDISISPIGLHE